MSACPDLPARRGDKPALIVVPDWTDSVRPQPSEPFPHVNAAVMFFGLGHRAGPSGPILQVSHLSRDGVRLFTATWAVWDETRRVRVEKTHGGYLMTMPMRATTDLVLFLDERDEFLGNLATALAMTTRLTLMYPNGEERIVNTADCFARI